MFPIFSRLKEQDKTYKDVLRRSWILFEYVRNGGGTAMPVSAVDLFCGIGGLTHGLQLAGLPVTAGIDIEKSCQFAYENNNNARFVLRDITKLTSTELMECFAPGAVRVLVGCAPCQPFSTYSLRYSKYGRKSDKWRLLYYFANLVEGVLPEVVSMENVPQLKSEKVFMDFVDKLHTLGYFCDWKIINCADYGVPQFRRRMVLLASRLGTIQMVDPFLDEAHYRTVREVISGLPCIDSGETDPNDLLHRASKLSDKNKQRIQQSVPGGSWRDWKEELVSPCHRKKTGGSYSAVYGRMEWDKPAPTITTKFYGYGNGRFGHPEQDRALSLREGALLQSFPLTYRFVDAEHPDTIRNIGVHIGNAVPVELGRAIGLSILKHLREMGVDL